MVSKNVFLVLVIDLIFVFLMSIKKSFATLSFTIRSKKLYQTFRTYKFLKWVVEGKYCYLDMITWYIYYKIY